MTILYEHKSYAESGVGMSNLVRCVTGLPFIKITKQITT